MEISMYYVCVENNAVVSILNYKPEVPHSVQVRFISDDEYQQLENETHFFDIATMTVQPVDPAILDRKAIEVENAQYREFLNSTDWKVMRHIRETTLGLPHTLSDEEYRALEQQRAEAAAKIR